MTADLKKRALTLIASGVNRPATLAKALCLEPKSLKPLLRELRKEAAVVEEKGIYSLASRATKC